MRHHRAGRFAEAEELYRRVLQNQPNHPQALDLLGTLAAQMGREEVAIDLLERAVALDPQNADAFDHLGNAWQAKGELAKAIDAYHQAVRINPAHAEALNNLGSALLAEGRHEDAIAAFRNAVALLPESALALSNLGHALQMAGCSEEAAEACRAALRIDPQYAAAHNNLGNALEALGQAEEAIVAYRAALRIQPAEADFHYNLGNALRAQGRLDEAIEAYREALRANPTQVRASHNLANAYREKGQLDDCIAGCRRTIRLSAGHADAYHTLGHALRLSGQLDEAVAAFRKAVELAPENAEIWNKLSIALAERGLLDESVSAGLEVLRLGPNSAGALNNLGNRYKDQGRLDQAIGCFQRALELDPGSAIAHSNLIFALHLHSGFDAYHILAEAREWDRRHAQPLSQLAAPHLNERSPDRRLRIGYLSGDFREHVAGRSIMPLLRQHDRERFEVFCYSNVLRPDAFTEQLRLLPVTWRDISLLDDDAAAQMIRADHIDLLIDLSAHSAGNRLLIFARKPAPVQVTYLGYPGTTGLEAMDYRLSDPYLDPPGGDLDCYSEQTVRLPHSYWCYQPAGNVPDAAQALPASGASITFGCLNNFAKVSTEALELWAEILGAIPGSRLLLHAPEGSCRERVRACLGQRAIHPERITFISRRPWVEYVQTLQQIDLALDPFPYGGGITTCDALWMGVPVVTLSGETAVGRGERSILSNIGLPELVAETAREYVEIAVSLAGNLTRLRDLRINLRALMERSPVCDAATYTREIERAWRELWRRWCSG